jgi:hypothetical protein
LFQKSENPGLKIKAAILAVTCALTAAGQASLSNYLGPGILTRGAGDIGTRSGEQVNLRFHADVNGIYDNGIQPLSLDSNGNLAELNGVYGIEAGLGVYGVHQWRRSLMGLDYRGAFRHYSDASFYDGSDHQLLLGYTFQKSRRVYFDTQTAAGTFSRFIGSVPGLSVTIPDTLNTSTLLLFDSRTYFLESGADMTILTSARTSFTVGGEGYAVRRQSKLLVGMDGYSLHGFIQHRLTRSTSVGLGYEHTHFDFPKVFGESDIDAYQLLYATQFARNWTFNLRGGVYQSQVQGLEQVNLDPAVASILGIGSVTQTFYAKNVFPFGTAGLTRQFKSASITLQYGRTVTPGNGVYLTSRSENASAWISYTGSRRFSVSIGGGEQSLGSMGQQLSGYRQYTAGVGMSYLLTHAIHQVGRYDARRQEIDLAGYRRTADRVTFGLSFSPGALPLSLW